MQQDGLVKDDTQKKMLLNGSATKVWIHLDSRDSHVFNFSFYEKSGDFYFMVGSAQGRIQGGGRLGACPPPWIFRQLPVHLRIDRLSQLNE